MEHNHESAFVDALLDGIQPSSPTAYAPEGNNLGASGTVRLDTSVKIARSQSDLGSQRANSRPALETLFSTGADDGDTDELFDTASISAAATHQKAARRASESDFTTLFSPMKIENMFNQRQQQQQQQKQRNNQVNPKQLDSSAVSLPKVTQSSSASPCCGSRVKSDKQQVPHGKVKRGNGLFNGTGTHQIVRTSQLRQQISPPLQPVHPSSPTKSISASHISSKSVHHLDNNNNNNNNIDINNSTNNNNNDNDDDGDDDNNNNNNNNNVENMDDEEDMNNSIIERPSGPTPHKMMNSSSNNNNINNRVDNSFDETPIVNKCDKYTISSSTPAVHMAIKSNNTKSNINDTSGRYNQSHSSPLGVRQLLADDLDTPTQSRLDSLLTRVPQPSPDAATVLTSTEQSSSSPSSKLGLNTSDSPSVNKSNDETDIIDDSIVQHSAMPLLPSMYPVSNKTGPVLIGKERWEVNGPINGLIYDHTLGRWVPEFGEDSFLPSFTLDTGSIVATNHQPASTGNTDNSEDIDSDNDGSDTGGGDTDGDADNDISNRGQLQFNEESITGEDQSILAAEFSISGFGALNGASLFSPNAQDDVFGPSRINRGSVFGVDDKLNEPSKPSLSSNVDPAARNLSHILLSKSSSQNNNKPKKSQQSQPGDPSMVSMAPISGVDPREAMFALLGVGDALEAQQHLMSIIGQSSWVVNSSIERSVSVTSAMQDNFIPWSETLIEAVRKSCAKQNGDVNIPLDAVQQLNLSASAIGTELSLHFDSLAGLDQLCPSLGALSVSDLPSLQSLSGIPTSILHLTARNLKKLQTNQQQQQQQQQRRTATELSTNFTSFVEFNAFEHLEYIDVSDSPIGTLQGFARLRHLRTLIADRAGIDTLSTLVIRDIRGTSSSTSSTVAVNIGPRTLTTLSASGNHITSIDLRQSGFFARLKTLDLSHNRITQLNGLSGLPMLHSLNLESNAISSVDTSTSVSMSLRKLRMAGNTEYDISQQLASGCVHQLWPHLESLNADFVGTAPSSKPNNKSNNTIPSTPASSTAIHNALSTLSMHGTVVCTNEFWTHLHALKRLYLSGATASSTQDSILPQELPTLPHLAYLEARGCNLTQLPVNIATALPSLQYADLAGNRLTLAALKGSRNPHTKRRTGLIYCTALRHLKLMANDIGGESDRQKFIVTSSRSKAMDIDRAMRIMIAETCSTLAHLGDRLELLDLRFNPLTTSLYPSWSATYTAMTAQLGQSPLQPELVYDPTVYIAHLMTLPNMETGRHQQSNGIIPAVVWKQVVGSFNNDSSSIEFVAVQKLYHKAIRHGIRRLASLDDLPLKY
ncbi:L domain-like protein [Ramicandelaber brevisporus]|nr:L domain-like protein [Ramicandelaber brevisporus]